MKSFTKISFAVFAFMLFFGAFAAIETKAQAGATLQEVLRRMEAHRQILTSLKTSVKMVKYNPQLDESDITEGTATYAPAEGRDARIRIDWTKPNKEVLAVADKKYILYTERLKQAIVGKASEAKGSGKANNLFAFINMSKAELKANYSIKYLGEEKVSGGTPTFHLQLTPKTASAFSSADLWVDADGMPIQVKVIEKNKDTTTVLLSGMQKNITIDAKVFKVSLPKGTKIIEG
jgi:outer membrane lipoprotein-sorting protein